MRTLFFLLMAAAACTAAVDSDTRASTEMPQESWEVRANIPYRVQEVYPTLHQGRIYLAGGLSPDVDPATQGISDQVYIYHPDVDQWSPGPSLPEPRHHPYLVSTGSELFSIGGFIAANGGRWSASKDILRLDEATGTWVKVAELLIPQSETVAAYIGGQIYLASGRTPIGTENADWNHQGDVDHLQVFDPGTLTVSFGQAASVRRNSAAGAVIDGQLYVVGGRVVDGGNVTANEVFDPVTGQWSTRAPMPQAQGGLAAAALEGRLYVFGGEFFDREGGGVYRESWVYDPATDAWSPIAEMPVPRHGLGAVTVGNEVFVIAGATEAGGSGTTSRVSVYTR
ncbi:MAG: kelch repeat-containing protein [Bacteroidota bacterium]